ncbi:MAG: restriction endonuclease [candidate division Zixibacteria bacterium]|nr:restriction endonuclease [candidate division Zixibacteria bacterium]
MQIHFDVKISKGYHSASQKSRVLSEAWVGNEVFCPNCGSNLLQFNNGKPVADFYCSICREEYELKSKKDSMGMKIVDGAYRTMLERLTSYNNPSLFLLNYDLQNYKIQNFFVVPKHFFVPEIIEKRKPLSETARRAGWVGCNILLKNIPLTGKIFYVRDGKVELRENILKYWSKTLFLRETKELAAKGWILDIMNCIDKIGKGEFSLNEVYAFEMLLKQKYPNNRHIRDKIRQQLQFLRDKGYLDFIARGNYRLR